MIISVFVILENIVGKGEIACISNFSFSHNKQFLLFPQCFQKSSFPDPSKGVIIWEWVKEDLNYSKSYERELVLRFVLDMHRTETADQSLSLSK